MRKKILLILFVTGLSFFFIFQRDNQDYPEEEKENSKEEIILEEEEEVEEKIREEDTIEKENDTADEKEPDDVVVKEENDFISCLENKGVVIYGYAWCPACKQLVEHLGGYDIVEPIYVECTQEEDRCREEMIGMDVPEIQIQGEIYKGSRNIEKIAEKTSCKDYY